MGKKYGVTAERVAGWLRTHGVEIRSAGESNIKQRGGSRPDDETLRRLYGEEGQSYSRIARTYGVTPTTVRNWGKKAGLKGRGIAGQKLQESGGRAATRKELEDLYTRKRLSSVHIAELYGVSQATIINWLRKHDIPTRKRGAHKKAKRKPSPAELEQLYVEEGKTSYEIGAEYGVSPSSVGRWLKQAGIPSRSGSEARISQSGGTKPSLDVLRRLYCYDLLTTYEIGEHCGVDASAVGSWLAKAGIPRRDSAEAWAVRQGRSVDLEDTVQTYMAYCEEVTDPVTMHQFFQERLEYHRFLQRARGAAE